MSRLRALLVGMRASFWFVPAVQVLVSLVAAVLLVEVDSSHGWQLAKFSPRLFGAGADGSRALLSAIATSMVTVAGVVFSITVVVLSQASGQYSPRVLRNFMRDRPTQLVLGVFVGVFAFCLVVLRTVRSGAGEDGFIPSLAVLTAMLYAIGAIAMLIFFVHHVAQAIQAATIIDHIAKDTRVAIDHLYPQDVGRPLRAGGASVDEPSAWCGVRSTREGYVVAVDAQALERKAADSGRLLRLAVRVGDFVPEGALLLEAGGEQALDKGQVKALRATVFLDVQRTTDQDAGFGFQQLVDVALKALSPGVNDASTALLCIDRLGALLARLAGREMPDPNRVVDGVLRVIAPAPTFEGLLNDAVVPLLAGSGGDSRVLERIAWALGETGRATRDADRRTAVRQVALALRREAHSMQPAWRATGVLRMVRDLLKELQPPA